MEIHFTSSASNEQHKFECPLGGSKIITSVNINYDHQIQSGGSRPGEFAMVDIDDFFDMPRCEKQYFFLYVISSQKYINKHNIIIISNVFI